MRSHYCGQVNEKLIGQVVTVAGWVHRRRDHGGVIFVDLRDREGLLQIVFDPQAPALFAEAERLRNEFVVRVMGRVRARPEGTVNPHLASGGASLQPSPPWGLLPSSWCSTGPGSSGRAGPSPRSPPARCCCPYP